MSNGPALKALTDKQMHGTDFRPSTADVGGENYEGKIITFLTLIRDDVKSSGKFAIFTRLKIRSQTPSPLNF